MGRPHGELELTNMKSLSDWTLTLKGRILATSESRGRVRESSLRRLVGRRLLSIQIDELERSAILRFSGELVVKTTRMNKYAERRPHCLLRLSEDNWPSVILNGTSSRWRGKSGYD